MALIECVECKKEISSIADKCTHCGYPTSKTKPLIRPQKSIGRKIAIGLLVCVLGYLALARIVGTDNADKFVAVVTKSPLTLENAIENVPAHSWKAIAISLPYDGTLQIEMSVQKGNDLDVDLIPIAELENYKNDVQYSYIQNFTASTAQTYSRSGNLNAGQYYFVIRDKTLGILSSSSSDVKVFIKLNP